MLVIETIIVLAIAFAFFAALVKFNQHCDQRFNHRFFTKGTFLLVAAAMVCLFAGNSWYLSALKSRQSTLNGIVLELVGIAILVGLAWLNIKRTNLVYGLGGTAIQIPLFAFLAYAGWPIFVIGVIGMFFFMMRSTPVWMINR
jgi:hypothetical protein